MRRPRCCCARLCIWMPIHSPDEIACCVSVIISGNDDILKSYKYHPMAHVFPRIRAFHCTGFLICSMDPLWLDISVVYNSFTFIGHPMVTSSCIHLCTRTIFSCLDKGKELVILMLLQVHRMAQTRVTRQRSHAKHVAERVSPFLPSFQNAFFYPYLSTT